MKDRQQDEQTAQEADEYTQSQHFPEILDHGYRGDIEGQKAQYGGKDRDEHRFAHMLHCGYHRALFLITVVELDGIIDAKTDEDGKHCHGNHSDGNTDVSHESQGGNDRYQDHRQTQHSPLDLEDQCQYQQHDDKGRAHHDHHVDFHLGLKGGIQYGFTRNHVGNGIEVFTGEPLIELLYDLHFSGIGYASIKLHDHHTGGPFFDHIGEDRSQVALFIKKQIRFFLRLWKRRFHHV